jgi:aminopeptidase-like protein
LEITELKKSLDARKIGQELHDFITELFPLCRSITGEGLRETLRKIQHHIPLQMKEVPTGTPVFDWIVPREWNIRDAYVKDGSGRRVVDFRKSNLHVLNYSIPVRARLPLAELKSRLFTLPDHPDWIPYRTSYYKEDWGFCLSHREFAKLEEGLYEVCIDSTLEDGSLTYGEAYLAGECPEEVMISCHPCHPSMCNDNLSGVAVSTFLAKLLSSIRHRYSYRFLFIPGTIGSITWLCLNEQQTTRIRHGLVLACLGDPGHHTYKRSRRGNAEIDRAAEHVLLMSGKSHDILEFSPYGYDERQFCSPGFDLPVGCLSRTPHGCFPEYHTSADNLDFVKSWALAESLSLCLSIFSVLEGNLSFRNLNPKCEPQLGRRGLYRLMGGMTDAAFNELAILWVLNLSDGGHSLLDIAERAGLDFDQVKTACEALVKCGLLSQC